MYWGPHLAITSLRQHVLRIPLCRSSAHSREQHYDFKALEFGKQRCCLLLQRRGCGTAPHGCQDLLAVLHKLILKGSKVPGGVRQESSRRKRNREPCSFWLRQMGKVEE